MPAGRCSTCSRRARRSRRRSSLTRPRRRWRSRTRCARCRTPRLRLCSPPSSRGYAATSAAARGALWRPCRRRTSSAASTSSARSAPCRTTRTTRRPSCWWTRCGACGLESQCVVTASVPCRRPRPRFHLMRSCLRSVCAVAAASAVSSRPAASAGAVFTARQRSWPLPTASAPGLTPTHLSPV